MTKSDEALVADLVAGDRRAYAVLIDRHASRFLSVAMRLMSNEASAEDMVQDAFVKLLTHANRFDPRQGKFTTWFYRVVSNRCLDELRKKKPSSLPENYDAIDGGIGTEEKMQEDQRAEKLNVALQRLPDRQKLALSLCYYEGVSNKQAAEIMEINIKALESLLSRARSSLKKTLLSQKDHLLH